MNALQQKSDASLLSLNFVAPNGDVNFLAFLQSAQKQNFRVILTVIGIAEHSFLLLQYEYNAFLIKVSDASSPEYERFFANIKFVIDIERDLATLLHNLPIEASNIDDFRVAKSVIQNIFLTFSAPIFKIARVTEVYDINFTYVKSLLIKGFEITNTWNSILEHLTSQNKVEIYHSIVLEKIKRIKLFNKGNISEISDIYNILSEQSKKTFMQIYDIFCEIARQQNISIGSVITITSIEAFVFKSPKNFEDILSVPGFNKCVIHNAVVRKLLALFAQSKFEILRNRPIEKVLEAVLTLKSAEHGIDRNCVASRYEIVACLNGNLNVDFLKGWKNHIFGECVLEFLHGKSSIEVKDMQLFIVSK